MELKQMAGRNPHDIGDILLAFSEGGYRIFTLRTLPLVGGHAEGSVYYMVTGYKTREDLAQVPSEVLI